MRSLRRRRGGEEGSALVIALAFLTAIGLLVAMVLSFNDAGMRASKAYKDRTRFSYAADGAMAAAIKRYSTTGPCNNFTAPLVAGAPDTPVNGRGVIVSCEGPPPAGSRATQPINSLLSLGLDTNDPAIHGITSSEDLRLLGDVFSNTTVNQTSGTMVVQGQVSAIGKCREGAGAIQTVPPTPLHCSDTVPPSPADPTRGLDPDYTKATTVVPIRRTVPPCPAGWLVSLEPGYYDDAAALNVLTDSTAPTPCNDKVVWFKPGTYYFDLAFRGGPGTTWKVNNDSVVVVAGTPRGWDPDPTKPRPTLSVPGSCKTETDDPNVAGVQLIAGGGSRLHVERGRMELCATANPTEQQLALYGYRTDLASHDLESGDITATGAFTDVLNAQVVDEQSQDCPSTTAPPCLLLASAKLTSAQPAGSIEFKRFRPGIPSGSLFRASDAATLTIKHKRSGPVGTIQATVDFPGNTCLAPQPLNPNTTVTPDTINLRGCGLARPEDLAGLKVTYGSTLNPGDPDVDVDVDGVVVEVGYQTPTTRKPTKVVAASGFANPDRAFEIGEQPGPLTTDAPLSSSGATTASVTVLGMGDLPMSPLATIEAAFLRVAHHDEGDTAGPRVTVAFPSGTCNNLAVPHRPGGVTDDRIDLKACGVDAPNRLRGLTATFSASLSPGGTAATSHLDGMWLELLTSPGPPGPPGPQPASIRQPLEAMPSPFANANRALVIGEPAPSTADVTLSGSTTTGALTVRDFNERIPLPPGSRIDKAMLRVAHQEDTGVTGSVNAVVPAVGGYPGGACAPALDRSGGVMTTHAVDLSACNLQTAEQLAAMTATYTATRTAAPISATLLPALPPVGDVSGFDNITRALAIDGVGTNAAAGGSTVAADARLSGQRTLATIKLSGFNKTPLPAGSTIETASLRIAHQEDGNITAVSATIAFTGNTSCTAARPLGIRTGTVAVEQPLIDVKACGLNNASQLADFSVLYSATRPGGGPGNDFLDGIALDITYRPPVVARLDGIELDLVFEAPNFRPLCASGPIGCDLLTVAPFGDNVTTRFVANGTIFAPTAGVNVKMFELDTQVLRRGVVARSIRLGLRPKAGYGRPTGSIPPEDVFFTAYPDRTIAPQTVSTTNFSNPAGWTADRDDGSVAASSVDADPSTPPPEVVLGDYDQTDLDSDDLIDGAAIRIGHRLEGTKARVIVEVDGNTCVDQELPARTTSGEEQIDLGTCDGDLADTSNLSSVTVTYRLDPTAVAPAVAFLDGITVEVLSGPLVRASTTFDRAKATVKEWSVTR